jgi:hypothetical protein
MKTQGKIEAAICEGVSRFEQDYMGRGPKEIHTRLLGNLLVVRLQGIDFGLASNRFGQTVELGCLANAPERHGARNCTSFNNPST